MGSFAGRGVGWYMEDAFLPQPVSVLISLGVPPFSPGLYISLNCPLANVPPQTPGLLNAMVIGNCSSFPQAQKRALCHEIQRQQPFGVGVTASLGLPHGPAVLVKGRLTKRRNEAWNYCNGPSFYMASEPCAWF